MFLVSLKKHIIFKLIVPLNDDSPPVSYHLLSLEDFLEEAAEAEEFLDLTEDTEENRPLENRVAAAIAA